MAAKARKSSLTQLAISHPHTGKRMKEPEMEPDYKTSTSFPIYVLSPAVPPPLKGSMTLPNSATYWGPSVQT